MRILSKTTKQSEILGCDVARVAHQFWRFATTGEVGDARISTDGDVASALADDAISAGASPDLFSGLGAWVLVMCIGVVSRER